MINLSELFVSRKHLNYSVTMFCSR